MGYKNRSLRIKPGDVINPEARGFARYSDQVRHKLALAGRDAARGRNWRKLNSKTGFQAARKRWQKEDSKVAASFKALARGGFLTFLSSSFDTPQTLILYTEARKVMGVGGDLFY